MFTCLCCLDLESAFLDQLIQLKNLVIIKLTAKIINLLLQQKDCLSHVTSLDNLFLPFFWGVLFFASNEKIVKSLSTEFLEWNFLVD